jgi:hypothetical protein
VRRILLALTTAAALALLMVFAVGALADGGHGKDGDHHGNANGQELFESTIAPTAGSTDPTLHGVVAAGAPWVIKRGEVRISNDGGLRVEVKGLVLTSSGTNPIPALSAALFCGNDTVAAATTGPVPFSTAGNAEIRTNVALPARCLAPVVLLEIQPAAGVIRWVAASGFMH